MTETLEADYVIVGAGAVALAFADTMLSESNANMVIVDRRAKAGGHWNDAYPFVRLHSPSSYYGVNSRPLGQDRIDETGLNRGLAELASGEEACAYFHALMEERLLPSKRVTFLSAHEYTHGHAISLATGRRTRLVARKNTVDATFAETAIPVLSPPPFEVAPGVRIAPPNALPNIDITNEGVVVIGAGKTAIDTALWLLGRGVNPDHIIWIRPRDAWLLSRENLQTRFEHFTRSIGGFTAELEAARDAASIDDLFARLESAGQLLRIDPNVTPTMYRCAIVSKPELEALRRIKNVVRLGHIEAIERDRIVLQDGTFPTNPRRLHIHCCADGLAKRAAEPIFQADRIVLQYVRRCSPTFSAAIVAHIEATLGEGADRNAYCTPVPPPRAPRDWLTMALADMRNRAAWATLPGMNEWLHNARLDGYSALIARAVREQNPQHMALLDRYRAAAAPAAARLNDLLRASRP
ncbi:hypothetical protein U91I_03266 [alpha proteobacterium U9-1i]|nr:hypothetical protein U91I_03266 [alpha proteobacterium U9-1i]